MIFNSWQFAIFLPIVFIIYWALPHKFRWTILLVSSYYFYMSWNAKYVVLILFTTVISYTAALFMEKAGRTGKKVLLSLTLISCLGVLFFFKYFNFLNESLADLLGIFSVKLNPATLKLMLPVGISFYTFQTLSYVIDVYRGDVRPEHHFGKYATFISFFPQLVAGPIERTRNLLPQIKEEHSFEYERAVYGLKLMAWGFFKKMVIADTFAIGIDPIYDNIRAYRGGALIVATVLFAIQIYCDFSGYSDIAIGTAKLFGIDLMTNFKTPYLSSSIKEFWSRWHISLSTWFRDYVYIPLGGNRVGKFRHNLNLLITFLVSGLWHGANWTYVAWGGVHGIYQIIENGLLYKKKRETKGIIKGIRILFVFCLCCAAWVFFRAQSITDALYVFAHAFDGITSPYQYALNTVYAFVSFGGINQSVLLVSPIILVVYELCSLKNDCIKRTEKLPVAVRWFLYLFIVLIVIFYTPAEHNSAFIYFQF